MKYLLITILVFFVVKAQACEDPDLEWQRTLASEKHEVQGPFDIKELERNYQFLSPDSSENTTPNRLTEEWKILKPSLTASDQFFQVTMRDGRFMVEHLVVVREECIIWAFILRIT